MPIQDVTWKTSRERWTIETGGERGSGRPVQAARHDDDDDDDDGENSNKSKSSFCDDRDETVINEYR